MISLSLEILADLAYISPLFIVANLQDALSFYLEKLAFELRFIGPDDDPFFAIVGRDQVSLMLKEIAPDIKAIPNHTRHEWAHWDAYVSAVDPDALYEEFRSRGVAFSNPLRDNEDGLRGFEVMDADGYILFFGRPST